MSPTPRQDPVTVLLVDDESLVRMFAADVLEDAGFEVIEAGNAELAIQVLESRSDIRVLVTDIEMPGALDGIQLARYVQERWPDIRVLLTSGGKHLRSDDIADAGPFLTKPYAPNQVIREVRQLVDG